MKTCTVCCKEKQESEFHKQKAGKGGLRSYCKKCSADSARRRYAENRESILAAGRAWHAKNKDRHSARVREWYENNKSRHIAKANECRAAKPGYGAEKARNRRAKKLMAGGRHTRAEVSAIFERQRGLCANCESALLKIGKQKYHVDHIMPLAKGGDNDKGNLQCLCPTCNLRKSDKRPEDWAKENGRLI